MQQFRLTYRGRLSPNGSPAEKHEIRRALHPQLKALWEYKPLKLFKDQLRPREQLKKGEVSTLREVAGRTFAPLVVDELRMFAELDVLLMRPGDLGGLLSQGGDIDNRLKTLFDALRQPRNEFEVPKSWQPDDDERPLFCLLEDDQQITKLKVDVDRLLTPADDNHVELVLTVRVDALQAIYRMLPPREEDER